MVIVKLLYGVTSNCHAIALDNYFCYKSCYRFQGVKFFMPKRNKVKKRNIINIIKYHLEYMLIGTVLLLFIVATTKGLF